MTQSRGKGVLAGQAALLLLPATLAVGVVIFLSYPAYPLDHASPLQAPFDLAMLLVIVSMGRRLAPRRTVSARRDPCAAAYSCYMGLSPCARCTVGHLRRGITIVHALDPDDAPDYVGFALLAPAAALGAARGSACLVALPGICAAVR